MLKASCVISTQVMWERLYKQGSSREGGTLLQLRNVINRRNIGKSKSITSHVNEIEDFLELCIECHLIVAALHFFSMSSLSDTPQSNGFPSNVHSLPQKQKKKMLFDRLEQLVDQYVLAHTSLLPDCESEPDSDSGSKLKPKDAESNPHLVRIQAEHSYVLAPTRTHRSLPPSITNVIPQEQAAASVKRFAADGVFDYASAVLNDGLLLLEFKDAIKEGDGPRILRCWKAFLVYFHYSRHINYQQEAFHILAQTSAAASPQIASQLTWSRVVNTRGGKGRNVPVDLEMEHLNRTVKGYIGCLGANVSECAIIQCGRDNGSLPKF